MNMMQQNLNNNINNQLNQMKTENQLLREKIMSMQEDQNKLIEQGKLSNAQELKQQMEQYEKALESRYINVDRMQNLMIQSLSHGIPALTYEDEEEDDDADVPEQKLEDVIDVNIDLLIENVKQLLTRQTSAIRIKTISDLKGEKKEKGKGYDWKPLREQLRRLNPKELYDIFSLKETPSERARKIVAKIEENIPLLQGGQQTVNPIASSSTQPPNPIASSSTDAKGKRTRGIFKTVSGDSKPKP
jgi:hypothetical protein